MGAEQIERSSGSGSLHFSARFPSGRTNTDLQQEEFKGGSSPKLRNQVQVACAANLALTPLIWDSKVSTWLLVPRCLMLGSILGFSVFPISQIKILA